MGEWGKEGVGQEMSTVDGASARSERIETRALFSTHFTSMMFNLLLPTACITLRRRRRSCPLRVHNYFLFHFPPSVTHICCILLYIYIYVFTVSLVFALECLSLMWLLYVCSFPAHVLVSKHTNTALTCHFVAFSVPLSIIGSHQREGYSS